MPLKGLQLMAPFSPTYTYRRFGALGFSIQFVVAKLGA